MNTCLFLTPSQHRQARGHEEEDRIIQTQLGRRKKCPKGSNDTHLHFTLYSISSVSVSSMTVYVYGSIDFKIYFSGTHNPHGLRISVLEILISETKGNESANIKHSMSKTELIFLFQMYSSLEFTPCF